MVALRVVFGHLLLGATQRMGYSTSMRGQAHMFDDLVSGMTKSGPTTGESWAWFAAMSQPLLVGLCAYLGH
eukprot:4346480-Pyramimonas_sp.AAC.1